MVAHGDGERLHAESVEQRPARPIDSHDIAAEVWPAPDREQRGLPATAASGVFALISGPVRSGRVLGVVSRAVIIEVIADPDRWAPARVVSLLGQAATGVPNGVRLPTMTGFGPLPRDAPVLVGNGEIRVGDLSARVVRTWNSEVPPTRPGTRAMTVIDEAAQSATPGVPAAAIDRLAAALRSEPGQPGQLTRDAAEALLGLGAGLTPGGDDILAGMLTGWHAAGRSDLARTWGSSLIAPASQRTTALSADLLRLAASGHACLELLAVLRVAGEASPADGGRSSTRLRPAVLRLLSVGHTSGVDLTTGLALGLRYAMTTMDPAPQQPVT